MRPDPTILGFDTSAAHCAAALLHTDAVHGETIVPMQRGQAEALMPILEATLTAENRTFGDLDAVAVGIGPGNFTGIRISVSAARGLALALDIPAVGVSNFEIMAFQNKGDSVLASLEAPRGQAYVQPLRRGMPVGKARLIDPGQPPRDLQMSMGMHITGFRATDIGRHFECSAEDAWLDDLPRRLCLIAEERLSASTAVPRPSPLYVRPADAAPASDPPPVILP